MNDISGIMYAIAFIDWQVLFTIIMLRKSIQLARKITKVKL